MKSVIRYGFLEKLRPILYFNGKVETDADGKIKFYVPLERGAIPSDVRKLSIRATAVNYPENSDTKMKQPFK